jgi:cytochrome c-type protein NapC
MHSTYLASKEKTCIDCHKGIAHHLPHIPPGEAPTDTPGQMVPMPQNAGNVVPVSQAASAVSN